MQLSPLCCKYTDSFTFSNICAEIFLNLIFKAISRQSVVCEFCFCVCVMFVSRPCLLNVGNLLYLHVCARTLMSENKQIMNIMKRVIATPDAPKAVGPYSQAIEVNGTLYISGQIPVNPADGTIQEDITAAAHQSLKNIGAILKEAGMTYDNVVKTTVLLADIADFKAVNEVYAEYFTGEKPARACYQAAALPLGVKVEIEAIAVK